MTWDPVVRLLRVLKSDMGPCSKTFKRLKKVTWDPVVRLLRVLKK